MFRVVVGLFLIGHGLAHAGLAAAPIPKDSTSRPRAFFGMAFRSWLLPKLGLPPLAAQIIGHGQASLAALGVVLAGLAAAGTAGLTGSFAPLTLAAASLSLALFVLFWHPPLVLGALIDLVLLATLLGARRILGPYLRPQLAPPSALRFGVREHGRSVLGRWQRAWTCECPWAWPGSQPPPARGCGSLVGLANGRDDLQRGGKTRGLSFPGQLGRFAAAVPPQGSERGGL